MRNLFLFFLVIICLQVGAQVPQDLTLSTYSGQSIIRAGRTITLTNGFHIPAGSTARLYIEPELVVCSPLLSGLSSGQNYVLERTFKVGGVNVNNLGVSRTVCEESRTVQYLDGLGRPLQTVGVMASPGLRDVVQPFAYDAFGREAVRYQPYTAVSNGGAMRGDALGPNSGQGAFYNSPPVGVKADANPYSVSVFETSPLNRILEQGAPGAVWQPGTGHTVKSQEGTNVAGEVRLWVVGGNGAAGSGHYAAGTLFKTTVCDENVGAAAEAGKVEEFKDMQGQVVLKRVWETAGKSLSTYYVYDDLGNLRYVLPPAVNANTDAEGASEVVSFSETDALFLKYMYGYHYDGRKRVMEKKVPGKGWERMVYNRLDQLVLSQDANREAAGEWIFSKYDAMGRVVMTGIYASTAGRAALQQLVDDQPGLNKPLWESKGTAIQGYSSAAFPQSHGQLLTVSYYGRYDFPGNPFGGPTGQQVGVERTQGLATGSLVNILGSTAMLASVNYYDKEGRVVQSKSQHQLNGTDVVDNGYSFAGELLSSRRTHVANGTTTEITDSFVYDHGGRQVASYQQIGADASKKVMLNRSEYNELGQLMAKGLHSTDGGGSFRQRSSFSYNERGWLKGQQSSEFSTVLKYEDGTVPQFNGNISGQQWGTGSSFPNQFSYTYDGLNRLLTGISTGLSMSEVLTYDVMGNIRTLDRDGSGARTYAYNGNRLSSVTGLTGSYGYDANGNAVTDGRNGMVLTYNLLNLPVSAGKSGVSLAYTYDAMGRKLSKNTNGTVRQYINGIEYKADGTIDIIHHSEGVAQNNGGSYSYKYNLSDHLGNVRYSFDIYGGAARRLQQDDYYAFGLRKSVAPVSLDNKYLYNGKEIQDELDGQYDYGARFYDPVIGRWNVVDPLAEADRKTSPYAYVFNNPLRYIDPDGRIADLYNSKDEYIGTDGVDDKKVYRVNTESSTQLSQEQAAGYVAMANNNVLGDFGITTMAQYLGKAQDVFKTGDAITDKNILSMHPAARMKATTFINEANLMADGVSDNKYRITQGMRTFEEQDALYAQGRTTPGSIVTKAKGGQSNHNFGLAFDIVGITSKGKATYNLSDNEWAMLSQMAHATGLKWGGNWKTFKDKPHFEHDAGKSVRQLLNMYKAGQTQNGYIKLN